MEYITFAYEAEIDNCEGSVTASASETTVASDEGLFLGNVADAFATFLRSAGFYVESVTITSPNGETFSG